MALELNEQKENRIEMDGEWKEERKKKKKALAITTQQHNKHFVHAK